MAERKTEETLKEQIRMIIQFYGSVDMVVRTSYSTIRSEMSNMPWNAINRYSVLCYGMKISKLLNNEMQLNSIISCEDNSNDHSVRAWQTEIGNNEHRGGYRRSHGSGFSPYELPREKGGRNNKSKVCNLQDIQVKEKKQRVIKEVDDVPFYELFGIEKQDIGDYCERLDDHILSVRLENILRREQIETVSDVLWLSPETIKSYRNMGKKSYDELMEIVNACTKEERTEIAVIESAAIPNLIANKRELIDGQFEVFNNINLSKEEMEVLQRVKEAYNDVGTTLIHDFVDNSAGAIQIYRLISELADKERKIERMKSELFEAYSALPNSRRDNYVQGFIQAYTNDPEQRKTLSEVCPGSDATIKDYCCSKNIYGDSFKAVLGFIRWCSFDLAEELSNLNASIYKSDRDKDIFYERVSGKTLEEVGRQYGITRERVRQIEKRTRKVIGRYLEKHAIIMKIYAIRNQDEVLTPAELTEYFAERAELFLYIFRNVEGRGYSYDSNLDVFIIENESLAGDVREYVDSLPSTMTEEEYNNRYSWGVEEQNLNSELLQKALEEDYTIKGSTYCRVRLTRQQMLIHILKNHYSQGIRPYEDTTIEEVRSLMQSEFGETNLPRNNRSVAARIINCCVLCGRGEYVLKKERYLSEELLDRIETFIDNADAKIIPLSTIFHSFEDELNNEGVTNRFYLQGILHEVFKDSYSFRRDYLYKRGAETSFYTEITRFIKESGSPVSRKQIHYQYPGITDIVISIAVSDPEILNFFGQYIYAGNLNFTEDDRKRLREIVERGIEVDGFVHTKDLFNTIMLGDEMLLKRNSIFNQFSLHSVLAYLFRDEFLFERPYIGKKGVEIYKPEERIIEYVRGNDIVLIDDITEFARSIRAQINSILDKLNEFNDEYLIINSEEIATYDYAGITEEIIEMVENTIEKEVVDTVAISSLTEIYGLPKINVPWTDWLIYSILHKHSSNLEVGVIGNQFKKMTPMVAHRGVLELTSVESVSNYSSLSFEPDNIDDLDSLIDTIMDGIEDEF